MNSKTGDNISNQVKEMYWVNVWGAACKATQYKILHHFFG